MAKHTTKIEGVGIYWFINTEISKNLAGRATARS